MEPYYLGIDASKGYADFVMLNRHKKVVEDDFQLDDTFEGHCKLFEILSNFQEEHPNSLICSGIESTGGFENNWLKALRRFREELNIKSAQLNPFGVSHNMKASQTRIITDKTSAYNIAEYLIAKPEKVLYDKEDNFATVKSQWSLVSLLTKQKTQLLNQLHSLLYSCNPTLIHYCTDGFPEWILKLLKRYPVASKLSRARIKTLAKIPYITYSRAHELIANAKRSVASRDDEVIGHTVITTVKQILDLKKNIDSQVKFLVKNYPIPELTLLKTFDGIDNKTGIGLAIYILPIERFRTVDKLVAFFGLHPVFKVSGDGSRGFHMSKQGEGEVRRLLFMVAFSAVVNNEVIKYYYQKSIKKGMERMCAIGLCMHKILRIIYGMLKSNTPFDPNIDKRNRKRYFSMKKKNKNTDKSRRYQKLDSQAPVSRRQKKKRKEQKKSQSGLNTVNEI